MVIKQGMKLAMAGVILGLIAAFAFTRVLAGFLFGVTTRDPLAFWVPTLVVIFAAFLATLLPARRASRVDPIVALRAE